MLFARKDEKNQKLAAMSMKIFDIILLSQVCFGLTPYPLTSVTPDRQMLEFIQKFLVLISYVMGEEVSFSTENFLLFKLNLQMGLHWFVKAIAFLT